MRGSHCLPKMLHFILLSFIFCVFGAEPDTVSSPLRVAQCRATCLEKFSSKWSPKNGHSACLQDADCFMCWENCELLQSNFQVWGEMCKEKEICFPGCQEACLFHTETSLNQQQTQPVIHTKGETVIHVNGAQAKWPRPSTNKNIPIVYVVMRKSQTGPWRQIIQTTDLHTRVPVNNEGSNSTLRILVVDSQGLVTIYSPDETIDTTSSLNNKKRKTINTEIKSFSSTLQNNEDALTTSTQSSGKWVLQENSLIHQKILVIGELSWEPKAPRGLYLVTWEVDGGGLKGNLYTDTTCVTLSLWPDTLYHIQVELVSSNSSRTSPAEISLNGLIGAPIAGNSVETIKSEILDLDTSRAQIVSTESQELLTVLPSSSENDGREPATTYSETSSGDDYSNNINNDYILSSSYSVERTLTTDYSSRDQKELIAGCITAILLFIVVLAGIFMIRRRHRTISTSKDVADYLIAETPNLHQSPSSAYASEYICKDFCQPIITSMVSNENEMLPSSLLTASVSLPRNLLNPTSGDGSVFGSNLANNLTLYSQIQQQQQQPPKSVPRDHIQV